MLRFPFTCWDARSPAGGAEPSLLIAISSVSHHRLSWAQGLRKSTKRAERPLAECCEKLRARSSRPVRIPSKVWHQLFAAVAGVTQATDPDWKAVEQALGNSGQLQAGDKRHWIRRTARNSPYPGALRLRDAEGGQVPMPAQRGFWLARAVSAFRTSISASPAASASRMNR